MRLTPITGPGGLRADGSDVALIDVEAVDAGGQRCPTFQQRVDFACTGPAVWRGGYNSGKAHSINNQYLDLECGINRVALRSTLNPGEITIAVDSAGLKSDSVTIASHPFATENGCATTMPVLPKTSLPAARPAWANLTRPAGPMTTTAMNGKEAMAGRFIESFAYTGPAEGVRVQANAADGGKIYCDRDFRFVGLPKALIGADWVRAAQADSLYSAADLMQLVVPRGTEVYVAHDARLAAPAWLTNQFKATAFRITVNNQPMKVFHRAAKAEGSITLGSNREDESVKETNAYIVFVNAAPRKTNSTGSAE